MSDDVLVEELRKLRSTAERLEKGQKNGQREQKAGFRIEHIVSAFLSVCVLVIGWFYVQTYGQLTTAVQEVTEQSNETAQYLAGIASTVQYLERRLDRVSDRIENLKPDYPRFGSKEHEKAHRNE